MQDFRRAWAEIEKEKIDDMPVKQAIGQVAENPSQEQSKSDSSPGIRCSAAKKQKAHNPERDNRERDEKDIVVLEGTEGGASVADVN